MNATNAASHASTTPLLPLLPRLLLCKGYPYYHGLTTHGPWSHNSWSIPVHTQTICFTNPVHQLIIVLQIQNKERCLWFAEKYQTVTVDCFLPNSAVSLTLLRTCKLAQHHIPSPREPP